MSRWIRNALGSAVSNPWWWLCWVLPAALFWADRQWTIYVLYEPSNGYFDSIWPSTLWATWAATAWSVASLDRRSAILDGAAPTHRLTVEYLSLSCPAALATAGLLAVCFGYQSTAPQLLGLLLADGLALVATSAAIGLLVLRAPIDGALKAWTTFVALWVKAVAIGTVPWFSKSLQAAEVAGGTQRFLVPTADMACAAGALLLARLASGQARARP